MSGGTSEWANVGFTRIGSEDWVTFRRWNDDPNSDEFWDGTKWVGSPEEALVHDGLGMALGGMFRAYLREGMAGGERTSNGMGDEATGRPEPGQRSRESLESQHGQVWDASQLAAEFEVIGFAAPLVKVRRKSNGKTGSFVFQHHPRFYFLFIED